MTRPAGLGQPVTDEFLLQIAGIFGAQSAAHKAMAERDRRRLAGEDVHVFWDRDTWVLLVGPMPERRGWPRPSPARRGGTAA